MTIQLTSKRNGEVVSLQSEDGKDEIAILAPEKGHYNLMLYSASTQQKLQIGRETYKQGYRFELSRSVLPEADDWIFYVVYRGENETEWNRVSPEIALPPIRKTASSVRVTWPQGNLLYQLQIGTSKGQSDVLNIVLAENFYDLDAANLAESRLHVKVTTLAPRDKKSEVLLNKPLAKAIRSAPFTVVEGPLRPAPLPPLEISSTSNVLLKVARVWAALMMREMEARFGHLRLGSFWVFIEPMVHVAVWTAVYLILSKHPPLGEDPVLFVFTGVTPFHLFRTIMYRVGSAAVSNRPLLNYPSVKPLDVMFARIVVESAIHAVMIVIFAFGYFLLSRPILYNDGLLILGGMAAAAVLGSGAGMVGAVITIFFPQWDIIKAGFSRLIYVTSCVFYIVESVDPPARDWLLYNPLLHSVEMVRLGVYQQYKTDFFYPVYMSVFCIVLLALGLILERLNRFRFLKTK